MKVAIAGAGAVGRSIARELVDHHEVTLLERNPEHIDVDAVPAAQWRLGDACELSLLESVKLHEFDVVIAATGDRVLVLEDTIELQCAARDHVPLRTRAGVVSMTELVRATMRLRPDRVIVGEVRGGEALDLVKVWGTGHPGGIATIHAGSALGALLRLEQLILEVAVNPPRALIAEAVNVVIHIAGRGRKRRVESIARVVGFDGTGYRLADALETPFPELMPVPLAADTAAPSPSLDQPGELP